MIDIRSLALSPINVRSFAMLPWFSGSWVVAITIGDWLLNSYSVSAGNQFPFGVPLVIYVVGLASPGGGPLHTDCQMTNSSSPTAVGHSPIAERKSNTSAIL